MLDFLPYFTAHKAHLGRAKVQAALRAYFRAGYDLDDDVSPFIKRRTFTQRKYGFDSDEFADWDLAMMMVATTNAVPTLFWTVVYVLSSPSTTASIREEVMPITSRTTDPATGKTSMTIDATKFSSHCPLLCAAYQESMRLSNRQMSFRVAEEDTSVSTGEKTYLIKKNAVVLIPSSLYSEDPKVWGSNAHLFEPARWLRRDGQKESSGVAEAKEAERLQKKAFFPFGGGRRLCPGRHFAFAEILGMVALLVVGFDVVHAPGQLGASREIDEGPLRVPRRESRFFGEAVPKPVGRYDVLVRRKKEFEGVRWGFDLGSS
jgi:cytochrome P450